VFFRVSSSYVLLLALALTSWASQGVTAVDARTAAAVPALDVELHGRVTDPSGDPLSAVTVQARTGERPVATVATEVDGTFRFRSSSILDRALQEGTLVLRAERLGYATVEVSLSPASASPVHLTMEPAPLPLPGFEVDAGPRTCEGDEGDGRLIWRRAAARHPGGLDSLGVASYTLVHRDTLEGDASAGAGPEGHDYEAGQRGSAPILRIGWARRIERDGYAFAVRRTDRTGSFDSWSYAPLEADLAPHFGTEQFGSRHYFQVITEDREGWLLRFCARADDQPHLDGRLEVGPDTLIRRAEWRFRTPEPDERAGGWAVFPPSGADGDPPPLLPLESMDWKTLPEERTVRRAQWFEGWILAPGDSVPFLPRREGDRASRNRPG
jgi:hypothetical protein